MDNWERIALWVVVFLIALKIFIAPQLSFYTPSTPMGIMDLAEFNGVPSDLKQFYQDKILNTLMPAYSSKLSAGWTNASAAVKQRILTEQTNWVNQIVSTINSSPPVVIS